MKKYIFIILLLFIYKAKAIDVIVFEKTEIDVLINSDINDYLPKAFCIINGEKITDGIYYEYGLDGTSISTINTSRAGRYRLVCRATYNELSCKADVYFNVIDNEAPEVDISDLTFAIGSSFDLNDYIKINDDETLKIIGNYDNCRLGSYYMQYVITDSYGNQTIKYGYIHIVDVISPNIICDDLYINVNCDYDLYEGLIVSDDCDKDLYIEISYDDFDPYSLGVYILTYTVYDDYGNNSSIDRLVYVSDRKSPSIVLDSNIINKLPYEEYDYYSNILYVEDNYSVIDIDDVRISYDEVEEGSFYVIYEAYDEFENYVEVKCLVNNIDDIPPIIEGEGKKILLGDSFDPFMYVSAYDNIEDDITEKIYIVDSNYKNVIGNYYVTYEVYDLSGNYCRKTLYFEVYKESYNIIPTFPDNVIIEEKKEIKQYKKKKDYSTYVGLGIVIAFISYSAIKYFKNKH